MRILIATALAILAACQGAGPISDIPERQYEAVLDRAEFYSAAIARVALEEGDIRPDQLRSLSESLERVGEGTYADVSDGLIRRALQSDGFEGAALSIAVFELEQWMRRRGIAPIPGGPNEFVFGERARGWFAAVARGARLALELTLEDANLGVSQLESEI